MTRNKWLGAIATPIAMHCTQAKGAPALMEGVCVQSCVAPIVTVNLSTLVSMDDVYPHWMKQSAALTGTVMNEAISV